MTNYALRIEKTFGICKCIQCELGIGKYALRILLANHISITTYILETLLSLFYSLLLYSLHFTYKIKLYKIINFNYAIINISCNIIIIIIIKINKNKYIYIMVRNKMQTCIEPIHHLSL